MHDPLPIARLREHLGAWDLEDATAEAIPPGATADVFLLARGQDRWVAKYAYDYRAYFEQGLMASQLVADTTDHLVAVPRLATSGERLVMVEWPAGHLHPLAVLEYVSGDPLVSDDPVSPAITGRVCGRVHAALLDADPRTMGIDPVIAPMEHVNDGWDLGDVAWLDDVHRELVTRAAESVGDVRWSVAVWDGPDIRVHNGEIGLIDFGHTYWQPLVHAVANRSLVAAYSDEERLDLFLRALEESLTLASAEVEVFHLYRLINAVIYARWAATHHSDTTWLDQLLAYLDTDLPRVGLEAPARAD